MDERGAPLRRQRGQNLRDLAAALGLVEPVGERGGYTSVGLPHHLSDALVAERLGHHLDQQRAPGLLARRLTGPIERLERVCLLDGPVQCLGVALYEGDDEICLAAEVAVEKALAMPASAEMSAMLVVWKPHRAKAA